MSALGFAPTTVILDETSRRGGDDDDLEHYYCECDENVALCGTDVSDAPDHTDMAVEDELFCVVCVDLVDAICERCGE